MKFRTEVALPPSTLRLTPASRVILLGSCFAEEVGQRLTDSLPEGNVVVNPCGVLYNPASIAQTLRLLLMTEEQRRTCIGDSLFMAQDGWWHSWLFSTKFKAPSHDEALMLCRSVLPASLTDFDVLVLTLGTTHCYRLREDGRVVANCHKMAAALFDEVEMAQTSVLGEVLQTLLQRHPAMQVVLTVSPYRYAKYGFHDSQLAKASLLLMEDELCRTLPQVSYFPAYEILLDELRDYRFYAADMLHPSEQGADYIFERFRDWCFTPELVRLAAEREKALRQQRHRPMQ